MRIDPSDLGASLLRLGGGVNDAAEGQAVAREASQAEAESRFESLDALLLKRLRLRMAESAATGIDADAARQAVDRTRELLAEDPTRVRGVHGDLARDRLRDLLGE